MDSHQISNMKWQLQNEAGRATNEQRGTTVGQAPSVLVTAAAAWVQRQSRIGSKTSREKDDQVTET